MAWISNYIHMFIWEIITHACTKINGGFIKICNGTCDSAIAESITSVLYHTAMIKSTGARSSNEWTLLGLNKVCHVSCANTDYHALLVPIGSWQWIETSLSFLRSWSCMKVTVHHWPRFAMSLYVLGTSYSSIEPANEASWKYGNYQFEALSVASLISINP